MSARAAVPALLGVVAVASAVLAAGARVPAALAAPLLAAVLGFVPGLILARRLGTRDAAQAALLGLCLSPFLAGGAATLLRLAGLGAVGAARATAALVAALCAVELAQVFRGSSTPPGPRTAPPALNGGAKRGDAVVPLALAALAAAAVALVFAANPALAPRSDGAFHAAITEAVARGALPPEDPFFAGLRLAYPWGPHVWAALWLALAPGLPVWAPLIAANAAAAAAVALGAARVAARLGGRRGAEVAAAGIAFFAATPLAWLGVVGRAVAGEVRGGAEVERLLAHGVDRALSAMSVGLLHPSLVIPLDKFVVLTPFSLALALGVLLSLALADGIERPGAAPALTVALTIAAALFIHPLAGLALAVAALAGLLCAAGGAGPTGRAPLLLAPALVPPILALAPYLRAVASGRSGAPLALAIPSAALEGLVSLALAGAIVIPGAWLALARGAATPPVRRALAGMLVVLAVAAVVLKLPGENQSKFVNLLVAIASGPAAVGWALALRGRSLAARVAFAALLAFAVLPTIGFYARACAREGADSADVDTPVPAVRDMLVALDATAPADAIVVDATAPADHASRGARGAIPAAPRLGRRSLLWGGEAMAAKWGYPPAALAARAAAAENLGAGGTITPATDSLLASLARPVFVIARAAGPFAFTAARYRALARAGDVTLVRVEPRQ